MRYNSEYNPLSCHRLPSTKNGGIEGWILLYSILLNSTQLHPLVWCAESVLGRADFPAPAEHYVPRPRIWSRLEYLHYLENYVEHFQLQASLNLNTRVLRCRRVWRRQIGDNAEQWQRVVQESSGQMQRGLEEHAQHVLEHFQQDQATLAEECHVCGGSFSGCTCAVSDKSEGGWIWEVFTQAHNGELKMNLFDALMNCTGDIP